MANGPGIDKWRVGWWVGGLALAAAFVYVIYSFIGTFVFGIFLYYATRPVYRRLKRHVHPPSLAAAISLFLLALPALLVVGYAVAIGIAELDQFIQNTDLGQYEDQLQPYTDLSSLVTDPGSLLTGNNFDTVGDALGTMLEYIGLVGTGLLHLFVMIAIAFYFLRDDGRLSRWFHTRFDDDRGVLASYLRSVDRDFNNVFFGNILNAFLTGTIGAITYSVLNLYAPADVAIPYAALVGLLAGAASLIPVIGMKLVYFPVTIYILARLGLAGQTEALWFPAAFFATSFVIVDTIPDLVLRPYVSGRGLHVGMVMLAYIFGPLLFGWYGIFLGPILLVLVVHFVRIVLPELIAGQPIQPYAVDPTYLVEAPEGAADVDAASADVATGEAVSGGEATETGETTGRSETPPESSPGATDEVHDSPHGTEEVDLEPDPEPGEDEPSRRRDAGPDDPSPTGED